MQSIINESVDIEFICSIDRKKKYPSFPKRMNWRGKIYEFKNVAYYHKSREGRVVYHIFHVTDGTTDYRLKFDPEYLGWKLEEVTDGNAN